MKFTKEQLKKRRLMMLSSAFAIFFTGYPHVWSVYQPYMMKMTGWTQSEAYMCFYLSFCTFVMGTILGGRLQAKIGAKRVVAIGGGIFSAGIILSAFLIGSSPIPLYITYGLMQGFGQGMIYTTIIATAQKWFPGRTGFASGIIVTANGLCGFFLAPISRYLLKKGGPELAFLVIGGVIVVSWILSSIFFCVPVNDGVQETMQTVSGAEGGAGNKNYTSGEMIRTKRFYLLVAIMTFGLLSYFLISPVSQTYQVELGIPVSIAVGSVMVGSLVNASARLITPSIADKLGRIVCVRWILIVLIAAMIMLTVLQNSMVTPVIVLVYGCYGGIMGNFPSLTSSIFGIENAGENYGYVMLAMVAATFGAPAITGFMNEIGFGMQQVFAIGAAFAGVALLCLMLLKREVKKYQV